MAAATAAPWRPSLQQAMLRVRDPAVSVKYYEDHFGMTLLDVKHFPEMKFSVYFLASLPAGAASPAPGTPEANEALWTFPRTTLELTHNHGTESDPAFAGYASGNAEPHRGFGHVGFVVDDVEPFCAGLEAAGVAFKKKLTEGSMRDIAFALDPDGYWIEILNRKEHAAAAAAFPGAPVAGKPSLQQVMYRIRDPAASVPFYRDHFGLSLVCVRHFPSAKFSLYFMGTLALPAEGADGKPWDPESDEAWRFAAGISGTLIELTHNHGTEDPAAGFAGYHNGNTEPGRGFGHIGFIVGEAGTTDLTDCCAALETAGVAFTKRPHEGRMRGLAFAKDPDGYLIEIIQRGLKL